MTTLIKKVFTVGLVRGAVAVVAFAFNVVVARKLGDDEAGLFFIALSFALGLAMFSRMGMEILVLRKMSVAWADNNRELSKGTWGTAQSPCTPRHTRWFAA